jgi:16S rRNA (cytosine1402-N4)-methyltransferase
LNNPEFVHRPVMAAKVVGLLVTGPGDYIDATVGLGGHAERILDAAGPESRLLGLDLDPRALAVAAQRLGRFGPRARLVRANFADLAEVAAREGFVPARGVLFDLGVGSHQLAAAAAGFSFQLSGPLDMRYDPDAPVTAADLVNKLSEAELAEIIRRYGEEPRARRIAREIVRARPITTTDELARVVARAVGPARGRIHPATRTFMALRIAVNRELENLSRGLEGAVKVLGRGGRIAVISFHSLEDRIVKEFFRRESRDCICPPGLPVCVCGHRAILREVTRRPVTPDAAEVETNPRARSAKLRVAEKVAEAA